MLIEAASSLSIRRRVEDKGNGRQSCEFLLEYIYSLSVLQNGIPHAASLWGNDVVDSNEQQWEHQMDVYPYPQSIYILPVLF